MTRTSGRLGRLIAATLLVSSTCPTLAPARTAPTRAASFIAERRFEAGASPVSVAVGDFDGDGALDLAVANKRDNTVSVLLGHGDGTFEAPRNFAVGDSPVSVAVGDFNGDGVPDLAVANAGSNDVSVLLGTDDGTFLPPRLRRGQQSAIPRRGRLQSRWDA